MSKDWYRSLSLETLQCLARREGVRHIESFSVEDLIEVLEEIQEEKTANLSSSNDIMRLKSKKYNIVHKNQFIPDDEQTFEIPEQYADTRITLLLRDPFWAFAYWDINSLELAKLKEHHSELSLHLRVSELPDGTVPLEEAVSRFEIPVSDTDQRWYVNLPNPGSWYEVQLICSCPGETQAKVLAVSNRIESPGGYWLNHLEELTGDHDGLELVLAGLTDHDGRLADNALIEKMLQQARRR